LQSGSGFNNKGGIYLDPFFEAYDPETSWITGAGINVKVKLPKSNEENVY